MSANKEKLTDEDILKYILNQDEYPTWTKVILAFGINKVQLIERILTEMKRKGDIILDGDEILVTKTTNEKLERLVKTSRRVR